MRLDTFFVGPQSLAQGAVVTGWQDYTPTTQGFGSITNSFFQWRRNGSNIEIRAYFTAGTVTASTAFVSLPTGLTLDTTKLPASLYSIIGFYSGGFGATGIVAVPSTPTNLYFAPTSNPNSIYAGNNQSNGSTNTFYAMAPISQWSSGTTTLADRAVEEYAFNTSTADSDDTSSFGYGSQGVDFGSFTAARSKRVRFTTPILPTDRIVLEIKRDGQWIPVEAAANLGVMALAYQTTIGYGMGIEAVSGNSTDINVRFGTYRNNTSTYGGPGNAWSFLAGGTAQWRVRKVSGGAAVGFPVSARNIVGDTSGTAVPTGYVGEQLRSTGTTGSLVSNTAANITSITLTPGTWDITGICSISASVNPSGTVQNVLAISANSASLTGSVDGDSQVQNGTAPSSGNYNVGMSVPQFRVNVTSNTTYYLVVRAFASSSIGTQTATGRISAVRIG
jgi:hypothetical protein